jgi:glucokinase
MLLAGDIGGTKSLLSYYTRDGERLTCGYSKRYDSQAYGSLDLLVKEFVRECGGKIDAACFGVPGPVADGQVQTTNLPWRLTERELEASLGIPKVRLVNDLVAMAAAIPHLDPTAFVTLHPGRGTDHPPRDGVKIVIAPGTGLGHAAIHTVGGRHFILGSEAGHIDFAPRNGVEFDLLCHLQKKIGNRVSVERLLAGPGIANIYAFLKESGYAEERQALRDEAAKLGESAAISRFALEGEDRLAVRTLELFTSILGSHAGNLMLTFLATGGVYLGGGIPAKILPKLTDGTIIPDYTAKGRLSPIVEATPLSVIKDDTAGLFGAAQLALLL